MNENDITIPEPVYIKRPTNYSCNDSPTPVLQIRYEGLLDNLPPLTNKNLMITLSNFTSFTVLPRSYATLSLNVLVITSLPAVTTIYGSDFIFRHGLTCVINQIPTNDSVLNVTVYNHKSISSTFEKKSLQFIAHTVLTKYS